MDLSNEWLQLAPLLYTHLSSSPAPHPHLLNASFLQHRPIKQSFKYRTLELLVTSTTSANNGSVAICQAELPLSSQLQDDRIKCRISTKAELMFESVLSAVEQVELTPESVFLAVSQADKKQISLYSLEVLSTLKDKALSTKPRTTIDTASPVTRIGSRKQQLLAGGQSGSIELFNLNRSTLPAQGYKYHRQEIVDLCWLTKNEKEKQEERFFVSASTEPFLFIWDRRMQVPGSKIEHRQQSVTALAPIKSTSFLSGGTDCTIKHWDLRNTNNQCECYIFKDHSSPISVLKPVGGDSPGQANDKFSFVSGSNSGEVMLFEQQVQFLHGGHRSKITAVDYHRQIGMFLSLEESSSAVQLWQPIPVPIPK